jgi:hypothetical protein
MRYRVPKVLLARTFAHFRDCGAGRRECQVLWTSPWSDISTINDVVHGQHRASAGGFELSSAWLNRFWLDLAHENCGVRVQVHTHPSEAFHSPTDDDYPIVHSTGFLSLVIPNFAQGPVGFANAFLAEIQSDGHFKEVPIDLSLEIIE